jgi:hypothetical protein
MAYDIALVLCSAVDISADGNQADQALPGGLAGGPICQFDMVVAGAITGTAPTLDMTIQEKIGSNYRNVAIFPRLADTGQDLNVDYANAGIVNITAGSIGMLRAYGRFRKEATAYRYVADVAASGTPVYNDVTIRVVPLDARGLD